MLRGLDFCAGSGIGSWAFERIGFCRTVLYIENDPFCQRLLQRRMETGDLFPAPIYDDAKTFDGRPWRGQVDFMFGGIPCQPWSAAGRQRGHDDERDLWPDFLRVLGEIRPGLALVENVPGLIAGGGLQRICGDLAALGYDAEWDVVGAWEVGAPHRRDRVWIVAYADRHGWQQGRSESSAEGRQPVPVGGGAYADVCYAAGSRLPDGAGTPLGQPGEKPEPKRPGGGSGRWTPGGWAVEPDVGRVAHGIPRRVDRLRMLGNAWVPQVAAVVGERVKQALEAEPNA